MKICPSTVFVSSVLSLLFVAAAASGSAIPSAGERDPGFSAGLPVYSVVQGIAREPNGKIVVVGWQDKYGVAEPWSIARLNSDGSLDDTFHAGFGEWADLFSVGLQADGQIIVAGNFNEVNGVERHGIVRLNTDGSLDPTFCLGGNDSDAWAAIRSFVIQPDGKIIIGGLGEFAGRNVLMRLNADGTVDPSFAAGEIIIWEGDGYVVWNMALQADGKILVQGEISHVQGVGVGGFFRLNVDGTLDQTFHPFWQCWHWGTEGDSTHPGRVQ